MVNLAGTMFIRDLLADQPPWTMVEHVGELPKKWPNQNEVYRFGMVWGCDALPRFPTWIGMLARHFAAQKCEGFHTKKRDDGFQID